MEKRDGSRPLESLSKSRSPVTHKKKNERKEERGGRKRKK